MNLIQLYSELSSVAGYLWERGWAEKNAGNISVNLDDVNLAGIPVFSDEIQLSRAFPVLAGKCFLITATGSRMRDVAIEAMNQTVIVKVSESGAAFSIAANDKTLMPTSELPSHLSIHELIAQRGSNEKIVMHSHITELICLTQHPDLRSTSALTKLIWSMHPETILFVPKGLGFVPYHMPGNHEIARLTVKELERFDTVLWERHGAFAIGNNLHDTFDILDIVAKSAKIWLNCKSAGFDPVGLNSEELMELTDKYGAQDFI